MMTKTHHHSFGQSRHRHVVMYSASGPHFRHFSCFEIQSTSPTPLKNVYQRSRALKREDNYGPILADYVGTMPTCISPCLRLIIRSESRRPGKLSWPPCASTIPSQLHSRRPISFFWIFYSLLSQIQTIGPSQEHIHKLPRSVIDGRNTGSPQGPSNTGI